MLERSHGDAWHLPTHTTTKTRNPNLSHRTAATLKSQACSHIIAHCPHIIYSCVLALFQPMITSVMLNSGWRGI